MPLFAKPLRASPKARLPLTNFGLANTLAWGASTPGTPISGRVGVERRGWKEGHLQKRVAAEQFRKNNKTVDSSRLRRVERLTELHRFNSALPLAAPTTKSTSIPPLAVKKRELLHEDHRFSTEAQTTQNLGKTPQKNNAKPRSLQSAMHSARQPQADPTRMHGLKQPSIAGGPTMDRLIMGLFQALRDRIEVQYSSTAAAFRAFDEESSGAIEIHQFAKMLDRFNLTVPGVPKDYLQKHLFNKCDRDRDGRITWHEFNQFMRRNDKHNALMCKREDPYHGERGGMSYVERCGWIRTQARTMCE